ncbi:MAG: hypothetical protein AB1529_03795 [Candidatus Micrarchaeota archaeon]
MKLLALGLFAILLLGCVSQQPSSPQQNAPSAPAMQGNATEPEGQPPAGNATPAPAQMPPSPPPQPSAPNPYAGMTLESIAASGEPVECNVTFTYQNKPAQARFYMKGTAEMRFEETASGLAQCSGKTITIIRDTRRYAGCDGKTIFPGCDWFRSDHSGGLPSQFRDLPATDVGCAAWPYDKAKFQTPGQSCSMN